jgi:hypothetical protein
MDPLTAAATIAPLVFGAFRRPKKGPNRRAIIERYRQNRPTGYTSAEDEAAAERTRTRVAGAAGAVARRRRMENARQVTARGLAGPAAAALEQQATDVEAGGAEEAARTSADQLYRAFQSNLGYERSKADTAFGAELGLASQEAAMAEAQNTGFWNSMLEAIPAIAGAFSPSTAETTTRAVAGTAPSAATQTYAPAAPVTPAQRRVRGNTDPVYR